MLSFAGIGLGPFRTDAPRLTPLDPEVVDPSGGGVGGNMFRPIGGSDC